MESFEQLFRDIFTNAATDMVEAARMAWQTENDFWTIDQLCQHTKLSETSLRELRNNPRKKFPKPKAFSTKPVWIVAEVMEWARNNPMPR